jgi:WD40 repeat protein
MRLDRESHFRSFVLGPVNVDFDSCVSELKHHKGTVYCVAYSFDSSLLASASGDNTVAVWNTKTGMVEFVLKGHTGEVSSVAWSPDGQRLATGEMQHGDAQRVLMLKMILKMMFFRI